MKDRFGLHKAYTDETSLMSRKLDIVSDFCGGGILLDIGCGTGEFISRVKSKFTSIIGIDLDDGLLKFSSQRFTSIKKIKILKLGVESIQRFGRNKFDFVTALDVIEHLDDPKSALRNIYNVLKPGGRFLMTTPNWPDKIHIRLDKNSPHKSAHSSFGWKKNGREFRIFSRNNQNNQVSSHRQRLPE